MAFAGVEFSEADGGGVALVCTKWLTPRKTEVFWPPIKTQDQFDKIMKRGEPADENTWKLFKVTRCFFETNDYGKAKEKIKKAEYTSELSTDAESQPTKRKRFPNKRVYSSDESEEDKPISKLQRPPVVEFQKQPSLETYFASTCANKLDIGLRSEVQNEISEQNNNDKVCLTLSSSTPTSIKNDNSEYKRLLSLMLFIKQQNVQILKEIRDNKTAVLLSKPLVGGLPEDFPIKFPLSTIEDVGVLEAYLKEDDNLVALISYLSTLGGRDACSRTNGILKTVLTNDVAQNYSFLGTRKDKKAFASLNIKVAVIRAVQSGCTASEHEVCEYIKTWLKHSPQRLKFQMSKLNRTV